MSSSNDVQSTQQPVVFVTRTAYPLPTQKYMIPTTWKRYHLSQLVNKALALATPIPFDFLVRGEILKASLGEWCAEHGVGEEETLEIEYIESVLPPQKMSDFPHEDWVSSVLCDLQGYLLTASYDGHVRAFDFSKNVVAAAPVHNAPITSLTLIPSTQNDTVTHMVATSSHDLTAAISRLAFDGAAPTSKTGVLATLHLHTAPVSSVSSNTSGTHLLTSSWDGLIGLWDTTIPPTDEVPEPENIGQERKKRRKVEDESKPRRKAPINVLKSHTARVSRVAFSEKQDAQIAYSCGFDSTVRVWDTENGICTHTITAAEKPFLDLAVSPDGNTALAASTDRTLTPYDLRSGSSSLSNTSASFLHPATPSCIAFGRNGNQVVTGAYDGVVRVWDLRSTKGAVASFKAWDGANKKVLGVDWKRGVVGVAGEGGVEVWKVGEEARN
ncbi:ribosome biogenesis protein YTM1 [Macrolepiota fuliginosa MF-IS2]|uniref:Ribosome biogenesis protein YTM1 n=1 Tax=Macrolepiota fuliginosa MF-IS2 TaxID=1400762 RepID=A0A9P5XDH6_9AGAR|nr:ribosome biogenesis protein YTM1 [Macrolepiota fuliginosa MF-IS2]